MISTTALIAFVSAALIVLIIPGPGVMYTVTRSLTQGRKAGLVSVLGLSAGAMLHVFAAAAGATAIMLTSATAFTVVKLMGAGYLAYLGVRAILDRSEPSTTPPRSSRRLFRDGVIVSAFNPKIAVFFLSFLPQFTDPARGSVTVQIVALGTLYVGLALVTDGTYALLASRLRSVVDERRLVSRRSRVATGSVYMGLGAVTALADRN